MYPFTWCVKKALKLKAVINIDVYVSDSRTRFLSPGATDTRQATTHLNSSWHSIRVWLCVPKTYLITVVIRGMAEYFFGASWFKR